MAGRPRVAGEGHGALRAGRIAAGVGGSIGSGDRPATSRSAHRRYRCDMPPAALRIDLWTKDMPLDQMKMFIHQILLSLGQTYQRASGEEDVAEWMAQMAEEFAIKSAIKM